jgi:glutathione peroxidase
MSAPIYLLSAASIRGDMVSLRDYEGKLLLIVNTASQCGLTPQYVGLERLYQTYNDEGFEVLGFPCNQFGQQEPDSSELIASFCQLNYGVSFPMFAKVQVNGRHTHPIFKLLKRQARGLFCSQRIKWNFTKFLVAQNGQILKRYSPSTKPEMIEKDIKIMLGLD